MTQFYHLRDIPEVAHFPPVCKFLRWRKCAISGKSQRWQPPSPPSLRPYPPRPKLISKAFLVLNKPNLHNLATLNFGINLARRFLTPIVRFLTLPINLKSEVIFIRTKIQNAYWFLPHFLLIIDRVHFTNLPQNFS